MSVPGLLAANARAAGLASRLLSRGELESLAGHPLPELARALERAPLFAGIAPEGQLPSALEDRARRALSRIASLLERWAGSASPAIEIFTIEQDRASLRSLVRGALQGAPAETRLSGLVPTSTLPSRALADLARDATPRAVASRLVALAHPAAPALAVATRDARAELATVDIALARDSAARARRAARRGDASLRRHVAAGIDVANAATALLLAGSPRDDAPEARFIEGGGTLGLRAFLSAAASSSRAVAAHHLAQRMRDAPLAATVAGCAGDAARLERDALTLALARQRHAARLDPLGTAPLLHALLRLAAQLRDLRRLVHGAALGAPAAPLRAELVTPWS